MLFIQIIRLILRWLPWALALVGIYFLLRGAASWFGSTEEPVETVSHHTILQEIEKLGKLELVRHNYKEIIELREKNAPYLWLFEVPDSKVMLISHGEAVGCIDLKKIRERDIRMQGDTVLLLRLPEPELCYYKLDMENTRIYSIEKQVYYKKDSELAQKALRLAERQMRDAALKSGILEQTRQNAESMLKPFLESVSGRKVIFLDQLPEEVPLDRG